MAATPPTPAKTSTVLVTSTQGLIDALSSAVCGEKILLAPGTYSNIDINNDLISGHVTIRSEYVKNQATLTDIKVQNSAGMLFSDLNLSTANDVPGPFGALNTNAFQFLGDKDIVLQKLNVHGSPNGTLATTLSGFLIRNSEHVVVKDSNFSYLHYAIGHLNDTGLTIEGNYFHNIYDDGVRGGGSSYVSVRNNYFTDFHWDPSDTDHPDAIQFWTSNTTTSAHNIQVVGNLYIQGAGGLIQGIFLRDEVGDLPYKHVIIENNMLAGTGYNGIAIYGGSQAPDTTGVVSGNIVEGFTAGETRMLMFNTGGISMLDNTAPEYLFSGNADMAQSNDSLNSVVTDGGASLMAEWLLENSSFSKAFPEVAAQSVAPPSGAPVRPMSAVSAGSFVEAMSSFQSQSAATVELSRATVLNNQSMNLAHPINAD